MLETWFSDYCPKCASRNFICAGDQQDLTGFDPEGIRCWNCGACWAIGDEEQFRDGDDDGTVMGPYYSDGVHFEEIKKT